MATNKKKKGTKGKKKLTPQELEQKKYSEEIRSVFFKTGFTKILSVSDKEFEFKGRKGDLDDIFVFQNIIVLAEYTCAASNKISDHLLKKKVLFDHILDNKAEFIEFLDNKFDTFKTERGTNFIASKYQVIIIYCARNSINSEHKKQLPRITYLDYPILQYFKSISDAIKHSARSELLHFLGIDYQDVGHKSGIDKKDIEGLLLAESESNFDNDYKVVTFYTKADHLLKWAYVLRKDSWRDGTGLYQRMIIKNKINAIRKYLLEKKRVFVNNIVVTLPSETKLLDHKGETVDPKKITTSSPVTIQIPDKFNAVGLIDGQHRVFAYHEGGTHDEKIRPLRDQQNLLVTGVIYPSNITDKEKIKSEEKKNFAAKLFMEINANQSNASSELKQHIELMLTPFSSAAIGQAIIHELNMNEPFKNWFKKNFYEKGKIQTSSIISFGLKPLVKLSGEDSLYHLWDNEQKKDLLEKKNTELLKDYINFCIKEIKHFFSAVKQVIAPSKWTTDRRKEENRILSTCTLNGLLTCLRQLIEEGKTTDRNGYVRKLKGLDDFEFSIYKGSSWKAMSRDLYDKFFKN